MFMGTLAEGNWVEIRGLNTNIHWGNTLWLKQHLYLNSFNPLQRWCLSAEFDLWPFMPGWKLNLFTYFGFIPKWMWWKMESKKKITQSVSHKEKVKHTLCFVWPLKGENFWCSATCSRSFYFIYPACYHKKVSTDWEEPGKVRNWGQNKKKLIVWHSLETNAESAGQ